MSGTLAQVSIFGVRHHGPGSARSLLRALESLQPDAVLIEGPPDAADVLPLAAYEDMTPPVALLVHVPNDPCRCAFYPFAVFSPEWQALRFGLSHDVAVRFIDLPASNQLAIKESDDASKDAGETVKQDPLGLLAEAAGYSDGERWWEHMVEQRLDGADLFAAVSDAMSELRETIQTSPDTLQAQREAHMRQCIRAAQSEGRQRIAVVCGAWHAPALADMPSAGKDAAVLKGLPKVKTQATWVPWTYGRLSYFSGYGAGIESPGWYHHLWVSEKDVSVTWMTKVARLLREQDLDASSAHVIEAVRLTETLAALRGRPIPGLLEMNEACRAVFCLGNDAPMRLIGEKLIVGEQLGSVPADAPMVPLQQDLQREQKRLRLPAEAAQRLLDLDLRKPNDLDRSHLLHRLSLLGIHWGATERVTGKSGTFHEVWRIQWQPELVVPLIEAARFGNTVVDAAAAFVEDRADQCQNLPELSELLEGALLADLPQSIEHLADRLREMSALSTDVGLLMAALPPLAKVLRYGSVRQTDAGMVTQVVDSLIARVCIGLPGACSALNDEAAEDMLAKLLDVNSAVSLLGMDDYTEQWRTVLRQLAEQEGLHGLIAGRCCRILLDAGVFDSEECARRLSLALSTANEASQAGAWVGGFLKGSGLLLLHSDALWSVLDHWIVSLSADVFTELLPLLRRTFATFPAGERRQMGQRVSAGTSGAVSAQETGLNTARAEAVLPLVARLLGLDCANEVI